MNEEVNSRKTDAVRWIVIIFLVLTSRMGYAQDTIPEFLPPDTLILAGDTAKIVEKKAVKKHKDSEPFKPNPKIAWKVAAIFPGYGQFYNRQYWKLPIVYGGGMGVAYAITWNNKTYQDYKKAYFSIIADAKADPNSEHPELWSDDWQVFVPGSIDPASQLHSSTFQGNLKRGKDYFRRYRDLSIIIGVGLYLIFMADAYVDAQMFDFDVSPDLSFEFTPFFLPETLSHSRTFGVTVCMNF